MAGRKPFEGKAAAITGAGRGIDYAIALAFAHAGADVATCSRTESELDAVRNEAETAQASCHVGVVDLSDPDAARKVCGAMTEALGLIYVLINNAGVELETNMVAGPDLDRWWRTIEINLRSAYPVTRFLIERLADGAKITNVSSGMGMHAGEWNSCYHASKAGLHMFMKCLADELWPRGIKVDYLVLGPVATDIFSRDDLDRREVPEEILTRFESDTRAVPEGRGARGGMARGEMSLKL